MMSFRGALSMFKMLELCEAASRGASSASPDLLRFDHVPDGKRFLVLGCNLCSKDNIPHRDTVM